MEDVILIICLIGFFGVIFYMIIKGFSYPKKLTKITIEELGEFKDINDLSIFNDFFEEDIVTPIERRDDEDLLNTIGYTKKELVSFASRVFKEVAKAWTNFDYPTLRRYYSDELFNKFFAKLENMKYNGYTHVFKDIKVLDTKLYNVSSAKDGIHAVVMLIADMHDYLVDNHDKIVSGSSVRKVRCEYRLTFTAYNTRDKNLDIEQNCKNCGAVLKPMQTKCNYCNTTVDMHKQDLVISNKVRIRSRRLYGSEE